MARVFLSEVDAQSKEADKAQWRVVAKRSSVIFRVVRFFDANDENGTTRRIFVAVAVFILFFCSTPFPLLVRRRGCARLPRLRAFAQSDFAPNHSWQCAGGTIAKVSVAAIRAQRPTIGT